MKQETVSLGRCSTKSPNSLVPVMTQTAVEGTFLLALSANELGAGFLRLPINRDIFAEILFLFQLGHRVKDMCLQRGARGHCLTL